MQTKKSPSDCLMNYLKRREADLGGCLQGNAGLLQTVASDYRSGQSDTAKS